MTAAYERLDGGDPECPRRAGGRRDQPVPLVRFGFNGAVVIEGQPQAPSDKTPVVEFRVVTPGYFDAMGVPLRAGRQLTGQDTAAAQQVVVINEAMARQFWPATESARSAHPAAVR